MSGDMVHETFLHQKVHQKVHQMIENHWFLLEEIPLDS